GKNGVQACAQRIGGRRWRIDVGTLLGFVECGSLGGVCSLVIGVRIGIIALLRLSVYSVSGADSLGVVRG
ncbi:hypothetical protein, partial [Streptococcus salivarius]|uniref:hypothetical protein n=1 Tax=Streptococcus salivarius TaxID=1304 RepID=UPI001D06B0D2